jgi:hypothetical protein
MNKFSEDKEISLVNKTPRRRQPYTCIVTLINLYQLEANTNVTSYKVTYQSNDISSHLRLSSFAILRNTTKSLQGPPESASLKNIDWQGYSISDSSYFSPSFFRHVSLTLNLTDQAVGILASFNRANISIRVLERRVKH